MQAFSHNFVCSFHEVDTSDIAGHIITPKRCKPYQGHVGKTCTFRSLTRAEVLAFQRVPFHQSRGEEVIDFNFRGLSLQEIIPVTSFICSPMELGRGVYVLVSARHSKIPGETYIKPCKITLTQGIYNVSCSAVSAGYPQGSTFVFGLERKR
jgi:hypothetical protein